MQYDLTVVCQWWFPQESVAYHVFVVMFPDYQHPHLWNFNSFVPADIMRVKFCVDGLFHFPCVPVVIVITQHNFFPMWVVASFVGMFQVNLEHVVQLVISLLHVILL